MNYSFIKSIWIGCTFTWRLPSLFPHCSSFHRKADPSSYCRTARSRRHNY